MEKTKEIVCIARRDRQKSHDVRSFIVYLSLAYHRPLQLLKYQISLTKAIETYFNIPKLLFCKTTVYKKAVVAQNNSKEPTLWGWITLFFADISRFCRVTDIPVLDFC